MAEPETKDGRAFLVGVELASIRSALDADASLEELAQLADTAGIEVVGQVTQRLRHPDAATYIGSGKVNEVRNWLAELNASIVIFDDELSPRHQRELERAFGEDVRVIDRTELILDIFAQHAHTKEGALQVTLAQYEYRLPRLTRQWTHLARQTGGGGARGGAAGVGLRGPGETQLETDRREIRRKISHLREDLQQVRSHRERHRAQRRRTGTPVVALVGYTNAGKSTLMNRLAGADVYVADQLFATLDPTTRRVSLPSGREILFTDTVGFIQKLPHTVVASFRATLEEINEATLVLHVVDASHPYASEQIQVVKNTLRRDLGIEQMPALTVFNKIDRLEDEEDRERFEELRAAYPDAVAISAVDGSGVPDLMLAIEQKLAAILRSVTVRIPYRQGSLISQFHDAAIVEEETHLDDVVVLRGVISPQHLGPFQNYVVSD